METKANHIMIGLFALTTIMASFLFILWLGRLQLNLEFRDYDIVFHESVSGLSVPGDVRYNGIKVGEVKSMRLDEKDPNTVWVRAEIDASTPIKVDTVATLTFQGVTGLLYIELSGGSAESAALELEEGQEISVIQSQTSPLAEVFMAAPDILAEAQLLLHQVSKLATDENIASITDTLKNIERATAAFGESDEDIRVVMANAATISKDFAEASARVNRITADIESLTRRADQQQEGDAPSLIEDIKSAAAALNAFATNANRLVEENRESLNAFSKEGLGQVGVFVSESRELVTTLNRVARQLEENPSSLIAGSGAYPEHEVRE